MSYMDYSVDDLIEIIQRLSDSFLFPEVELAPHLQDAYATLRLDWRDNMGFVSEPNGTVLDIPDVFGAVDAVTDHCEGCRNRPVGGGVRVFTPDYEATEGHVGTSVWSCTEHAATIQNIINADEMARNQQNLFPIA
jgi:hypothetical protein